MRRQEGFTLVEMVIAVTIASIVVAIFAQFIAGSLNNYSREATKTELQQNTKQAIEYLTRQIKTATTVEANNASPDPNSPGAPSNKYSWISSAGASPPYQNATLVLAVPAKDASNNLIYSDINYHNSIYTDDLVYYIDSTSKILYQRIIKNPNAPGDVAISTCPAASATPGCPADAKVVEDVANLQVSYFDATNTPTLVPTLAKSIQITLQQSRVKGGHSYSSSFTTQVTLRNK